jgi:SAM-dependent methyltransferase
VRELRCPICDETRRAIVYRSTLPADADGRGGRLADPLAVHFQINRCAGCGLVYSSPVLDAAGVNALYTESSETNVTAGEEANVRRTFAGYYELARRHLRRRDRVLDIGCDIGLLLGIAREDGFRELHGVEPNPIAAARARAVAGSVVTSEFYEAIPYPAGHFDLVTLIHVVDHLVDVNRVLAKVFTELRPGGVVVSVVHNVESPLARALGERFPPFNAYHHYFFTKRTLAALFRRAGFEPIRAASTRNVYSLGFLARRAPLPLGVRRPLEALVTSVGLARVPLSVPLGNIGLAARKPAP